MAFFDDAARKAQLNEEIETIRKDIDSFYTQLGEATYKNLSAEEADRIDVQPVISNLNGAFVLIRAKEDEIARIEAEAQARREEEERRKKEAEAQAAAASGGTGVCHVCGAALVPDAKFCVQCGSPVQKQEPAPEPVPEEKRCPKCGARADDDARFCIECGTKLE